MATAHRLGWKFKDEVALTTDKGRELDLKTDSPAAIRALVRESVKEWRWKRVRWGEAGGSERLSEGAFSYFMISYYFFFLI